MTNPTAVRFLLVSCLFLLSVAEPQCALEWQTSGQLPGANATVHAVTYWDPDGAGPAGPVQVLGGMFSAAGSVSAARIVTHDPATDEWTPLGSGTSGSVNALAVLANGDLVAGGSFSSIDGVLVWRIARWDGTNWTALGAGATSTVYAIDVAPNGDVVIGTQNGVSVWDGTTWTSLGATNSSVNAVAAMANGDIFVGGSFTTIGGVAASRIARWSGGSWSEPGSGQNSTVRALAELPGGILLAGGSFGGRLRTWDGSSWGWLGGVGPNDEVRAIEVMPNGDVIIGGFFWSIAGTSTISVAKWDGANWGAMNNGLGGGVLALAGSASGAALAGGTFTTAELGTVEALRAAEWDGSSWSSLSVNDGADSTVLAVHRATGGAVFYGGGFANIGGVAANGIASFDGSTWSALGSGVDGSVRAITELPNGDLIVGGSFGTAGGVTANNIARWDGSSWHALGTGVDSSVWGLAVDASGDVIVAGWFFMAGGVVANNVARWDGSSWNAMGSGLNNDSFAVTVLPSGDVLVGGEFTTAGGVSANRVARWDGTTWHALGSGVANGEVRSFALMPNGDVAMGGRFVSVGGVIARGIARWDGSSWHAFGEGVNVWVPQYATPEVLAIEVLPDGDLLIGGQFEHSDFQSMSNLARWGGSSWSEVVGGVNNRVYALQTIPDGRVAVGGGFTSVDGQTSPYLAYLRSSCEASAEPYGAGCVGSGGPNVLTADNLPWIGSTFQATATGMPAGAFALVVTGYTQTAVPMPAILPIGVPGCELLATPDAIDVQLPVAGSVVTSLPLPDSPSLVGAEVYRQVVPVEIDAMINFTSLTGTNGLRVTVGSF